MRVLDTRTGQFVQINPRYVEYAILSHTWIHERGKSEQTFEELRSIQRRYETNTQIGSPSDSRSETNPSSNDVLPS